jgi:hypothetical protein
MIDTIYYDGDSFSCYGVEKNTGTFLAEHYNARLTHCGKVGKSPNEIIANFLNTDHNTNTLYFIGFGVAVRNIEITNNGGIFRLTQKEYAKKFPNLVTEEYLLLSNLVMLSGYCRSRNLKYLIHNLDYEALHKFLDFKYCKKLVTELKNDPNIVGFVDNLSLHHLMLKHNLEGVDYEQYGHMSHPSEAGHKMYADFLIDRIN